MQLKLNYKKGFTLIEILLVIVAIAILAAIVLVAINPNRQLAQVRNAQRQVDINTINKALEQILIDTGTYPVGITDNYQEICATGSKSSETPLTDNPGVDCTGKIDLRILIPTYIAVMPKDPQSTGSSTGYYVAINSSNNKISVKSVDAELSRSIVINDTGENLSSIDEEAPIVPAMWVSRLTTPTTVGSAGYDAQGSITMTSDGGSYQAFHFYPNPSGNAELAIVKRDSVGVVEWSRLLSPNLGGALGLSSRTPIVTVGNNEDIFISEYWSSSGNSIPVWALDNQGNIKWQKNYLRDISLGSRRLQGMKYNPTNNNLYLYGYTSERDGYIANIDSSTGNVNSFKGFNAGVNTRINDILFSEDTLIAIGNYSTNQGFIAKTPLDLSSLNTFDAYSNASGAITFKRAALGSNSDLFIVGNGDSKLWSLDSSLNMIWGRNLASNINISGTIDFTVYNNEIYLAGRSAGTVSVPGYSGWADGRIQKLSIDGSSVTYNANSRAVNGSASNYQYVGYQQAFNPEDNRFIAHYSSQNAISGYSTIAIGHQIEMPIGTTTLNIGGVQNSIVGATNSPLSNTLITGITTRTNPTLTLINWNDTIANPKTTNMSFVSNDASSTLQWEYYNIMPPEPLPTPITATYSQSSVYSSNQPADQVSMTNNIFTETSKTGTNSSSNQFITFDLGSNININRVVVGADFNNTLSGGWGKGYAENKLIQVSTDNINWTNVGNTGTFNSGIQLYSFDTISARYVRLYNGGSGYIAVTEFYAGYKQ